MKKYILFIFLAIILVLGVFYFKEVGFKSGRISATGEGSYNLGIGESIILNRNNIELEDVDNQGNVKFYINSIRYSVKGSGKFSGFEVNVIDYNYDNVRVKRKATLFISTYKPEGSLMIGESTVVGEKTIILEDVDSKGNIEIQISGKPYTISEDGNYENIGISIDDFYFTNNQEEKWVKFSFNDYSVVTTITQMIQEATTTTNIFVPSKENYNFIQQIFNWISDLFNR